MNRSKLYPLVTCLLVTLVACGGGGGGKDISQQPVLEPSIEQTVGGGGGKDISQQPPSDYKLSKVQQASNQISTKLSSLITGVSSQNPTITGANCDGSSAQPVSFSMWVGDYTTLDPDLSTYSTDLDRVAQMTTREQIFFSNSQKYTTLVSSATVDTSFSIPKGTQEVWYEFYCTTGTLSAGKVAV